MDPVGDKVTVNAREPMTTNEVVNGREYLSEIGHWPVIPHEANPEIWLQNFLPDEMPTALALLDSFIHFNRAQTEKLCESAFHTLSDSISAAGHTYAEKKAMWDQFCDEAIFTHPTGEDPNPSDSGHIFIRVLRERLGFAQDQLVDASGVGASISSGRTSAIVFVDDFSGSGEQFLHTWRRVYQTNGISSSIEDVVAASGVACIYAPAVATRYSVDRLAAEAPSVRVHAAHVLQDEYSAMHPDSTLYPEALRADAAAHLTAASARAAFNRTTTMGFHDLGLAIGFEHGVPDAAVGVIRAETDTWKKLTK